MHRYATVERYTDSGPVFYVVPGRVELVPCERRIYSSNSLGACVDKRLSEEDARRNITESPGTASNSGHTVALRDLLVGECYGALTSTAIDDLVIKITRLNSAKAHNRKIEEML